MTYADEVLADSPIAYWRLEETSGSTLTDETGNGHDGTTVNSPLLDITGRVGSAIHFDDAVDRFDTDTLGDFGSLLDGATVEYWIKWSHSNDGQAVGGALSSGSDWYVAINWNENASSDPGNIFSFLRDDSSNGLWASPGTNPGLNDGLWHHIVWVAEDPANNTMRCYVDGSEVTLAYSTAQGPSSFSNFDQSWPWGARNDAGTIDMEAVCELDEPAVYGTALSATRVQAHYDAAPSDVVTFTPHTVLLKHQPQFDGRFSPHVVSLKHLQAVPLQYHVVNLAHLANTLSGDESEEAQAKALRKALGHGWGIPDPPGSAKEKMETPRENWPIDRFHEAERIMRQEGVEESTAKAVGSALRRLGEDIQLDVRANLQKAEWHANAHTHEPGDRDTLITQIDSDCGPGPALWVRLYGPNQTQLVRHDEHGGGWSGSTPNSVHGPYGSAAAVDPGNVGEFDVGPGSCAGTHTVLARFQFYGSNGDGGIFVFADRPAGSNNFEASGRGFTKSGEDKIVYRIKTGGATSGNTWTWSIPVNMNIWHTIIARHDPETGDIRVWLDGAAAVFDNIGTDLEPITDGEMDLFAGQNNLGSRSYETSGAALAEVITWDRPLTDQEINDLISVT